MSRTSTRAKTPTRELAAPQPKQDTEVRILINDPERGTSGLKEWSGFVSEAYNAALYWPGVSELYHRLRTSCPEMVMIGRAFTAWARNVEPQVDLPENPTDDDKRYQDFILSDFDNMEGGFGQYLETVVGRTPFDGFSWLSVVPSMRNPDWIPPAYVASDKTTEPDEWRSEEKDNLIGVRRLAYRDSSTLARWDMTKQKRLRGFVQQDFPNPEITLPLDQSLHHQFGDPSNPEGNSPLQAVWRLERIKYGLEVIQGIGFEHAAGYLNASKSNDSSISNDDKANVKAAARAILTAQEGNYAFWPFGITGKVEDVPFGAAPSLLEAIKHYSILMLSVYMMQFIALNTMTSTGAQASQVDSTNMGIFTFNSMLDGIAKQYDDQVGKRLYKWNRNSFPGLTARPKITFSHVKNNVAMQQLGSFLTSLNGIVPLGPDDIKAIRRESGWMPENSPEPGDEIKPVAQSTQDTQTQDQRQTPEQTAQLTYNAVRSKLRVWKRGESVEL
jgi:hypothetical protein